MEYSRWIFLGFPLYVLGTIINPIIRSDGSPKYAMLTIASGAIINIILDPVFIFVAHMGMNGAALATFIGQAVTFVLSVAYLCKAKTFKLQIKSLAVDWQLFGMTLKLGVSSFLTQISITIISIVTNKILGMRVATGELGYGAVGYLTIAFKVFGIIVSIAIGVACGGQPILGYNYGAKKYDRIKKTYQLMMLTTLVVGVIATLIFEFCPQIILSMFGTSNPDTFSLNIFRIYLSMILLTCLTKAHSIFFQAIGNPVKAIIIALCRDFLFLVPLTIIFPIIGGINWFYWSAPVADILTMLVTVIFAWHFLVQLNRQARHGGDVNQPVMMPSKPGIVITISREHGAGGHEIGQKLANKLGIPFYDKEVAMLAGRDSGLAAQYLQNMEDQSSLLYQLYLSSDVNQMAIKAQSEILRKIADAGACVIVGRAADWVLRDYKPYKIHIFAPLKFKVQRIMQNYGDNENLAKENIKKTDQRRAKFYQGISGQKWSESTNYNLCLDSSIGIDTTVSVLVNLLKTLG